LAIVLALTAALLFALAAVLQEQGTKGVDSDVESTGVGFFARLVKRKVWLAGIATDIAGFVVQAAALAVGSLLLVQPLLVTTLVFALPLAAYVHKRRLTRREWFWAVVLCAALTVFMVLGQPEAGITQPSGKAWIIPIAILVPVVAVCIIGGSRMKSGSAKSLVLAIGAGMLLGYSAPFTKTGIDAFGQGILNGLSSWEFWAMAVTATLGTLWQQSSYQAGDVQTSLPAVTVLKPIIAMALGLTIYQEHLRTGHAGDLVVIAALVATLVATLALGRMSGSGGQPAKSDGPATHDQPQGDDAHA